MFAQEVRWPYQPHEYEDPSVFYDKPLPRAPFKEHVSDDGQVSAFASMWESLRFLAIGLAVKGCKHLGWR